MSYRRMCKFGCFLSSVLGRVSVNLWCQREENRWQCRLALFQMSGKTSKFFNGHRISKLLKDYDKPLVIYKNIQKPFPEVIQVRRAKKLF